MSWRRYMHIRAITRPVTITALLWLSVLYLGACGAQDKPATPFKEEDLMIAEICAESERYVGRVVTLRGLFQDWRVAECQFPEGAANYPRTRSDWLIRTGDDCVYVTGGMPKDFDPMKPENLGRRIELEAEVMQDEDGKVYLAYQNSRRL
jgi:hypothetical protein